jgi:hypothetical protein
MQTYDDLTDDDLGVSESIGYILVFAIVLTGIAGIVFFGATMLNDAKDRNNFQNVEQGMTVVQSDLKRVAMEKAPVKTSKMHVEGGVLSVNLTASSIKIDYPGEIYNNKTGSIAYYSSTSLKSLSIENGGLLKSYDSSPSDLGVSPPRIYASGANNAMVINIIRLTGEDSSFAGAGTANVIMEYMGNNVYQYTEPGPNTELVLTIDTNYPNAWAQFIDDAIKMSPMSGFSCQRLDSPDDQVIMKIRGVKLVIISEHTINIKPFVLTQ